MVQNSTTIIVLNKAAVEVKIFKFQNVALIERLTGVNKLTVPPTQFTALVLNMNGS